MSRVALVLCRRVRAVDEKVVYKPYSCTVYFIYTVIPSYFFAFTTLKNFEVRAVFECMHDGRPQGFFYLPLYTLCRVPLL